MFATLRLAMPVMTARRSSHSPATTTTRAPTGSLSLVTSSHSPRIQRQRSFLISRFGDRHNWLDEEKGIAPHIPVFEKSKRDDGTFSRSDFRYDPTDDVYHCPGGKRLGTSGTVHEGKTLLYRASKLDCDVCPLKPQCCPKEPSRKIPRD